MVEDIATLRTLGNIIVIHNWYVSVDAMVMVCQCVLYVYIMLHQSGCLYVMIAFIQPQIHLLTELCKFISWSP